MKTFEQHVKPSTTDRLQGSAKILSGKIKEDAGNDAAARPGVTGVQNDLIVK